MQMIRSGNNCKTQILSQITDFFSVFLKHRVNWSAVCDAIGVLPWQSIWIGDKPVERLNVHLTL